LLTDLVAAIHAASNGTHARLRVHAELVHGNGISVGHNTVQPLMSRAGLAGLPTRRRGKRSQPAPETVSDLVKRQFGRDGPNQLWVTDITEHPVKASCPAVSCSIVTPAASSVGPSTPAPIQPASWPAQ